MIKSCILIFHGAAVFWLGTFVLVCPIFALGQTLSLNIENFEVDGPNPFSDRYTRKLLDPYLGKHDSIEPVQQAASALESALRDAGYAFYITAVPPQPITATTIKLRITAFPIREIIVSGNSHFSEENILRSVPALKVDESPNTKDISRSLRVANVHPRKRLKLRFAAADDNSGVPAQITVRDAKPVSLFLWANNTGTEDSGENRVGVGVQHGNIFNRDHVGIATWTTSPDQDADVSQFGLNYQIPLYRAGGLLSILAARSDIDTGIVAEVFNVAGKGDAYAVQYTQLFPKVGRYQHQLSVGMEDKLFDNDIDFEGSPIGVDVRSRPGLMRYVGSHSSDRTDLELNAGYFHNINSGSFNNDEDYAASRSGADSNWQLVRLGAALQTRFGGWTLYLRTDGQYTDEPLISGEQFGLTGVDAVRGFQERELTSDRGYFGTLQIWTPTWRNVQFIVFVDGASGRIIDPLPGQLARETVSSAGAGVRWSWRKYLALSLYWANVIDGASPLGPGTTRDGDDRIHFSLVMSY